MPPAATGEVRRSTRVLVHIPIVISGVDSEGVRFEAPGETMVVNKHGAKIFTHQPLRQQMDIVLTIPDAQRSVPARVVWAEQSFGTIAELKFGIELQNPENFWGIYLPPEDWEESTAWEEEKTPEAAELVSGAAPPLVAEEPPREGKSAPTASPTDSGPLTIPAQGVEVFVRGLSAVRVPFQDKTVLRPVDEQEATILVRPVVDVGTLVSVIFPGANLSLKARTSGVSARRHEGKWMMWIKFLHPVRVAAP